MSEEHREKLSLAVRIYGVDREFSASNIGADSGMILQCRAKGYIHGSPGEWRVSNMGVRYLKRYVMRN